jgi:hypothetical protein
MEGEMEVQIPMDLHGRHNWTITCQGIGGIRAGGEECAKGGVRLEELARREKEPKGDTQRSGWCRQGSLFWTGMVHGIP